MYGMLFLAFALREVELQVESLSNHIFVPPIEPVPHNGAVLGVATERLKALHAGYTYYHGRSGVLQAMYQFASPPLTKKLDDRLLWVGMCRDIAAILFILEVQKTLRPYRDIEAGTLGVCAGWKVVYVPHQRRR